MEEGAELGYQGAAEGDEERDGQGVTVEEVLVPVGAVCCVGKLDVEAHDCGEELSDEEDGQAGEEIGGDGEA